MARRKLSTADSMGIYYAPRAGLEESKGAMGVHGRYQGYTSYQYLKGPKDYREFDLVEGEGPFPSYLVPLTSEQEKRVLDLAERTIIISLHEHPHLFPKDMRLCPEYDKQGRTITAYEALA